ncbi:MAG: DUF1573 domain-containing protein [Microscillaceae bacterium]|nr:DUF1573 domain-containing protein [Microscillaceae bacterium]
MKKITVLFICLLAYLPLFSQGIMNFAKETHDFGNIEEGTVATYEFEFTNTGNQPIEIVSVKASCGCTTPFWTQEIIEPGQTGKIKASYDSKSRPGPFTKSITVKSNAEKSMHILYIKGFVNPSSSSITNQEGKKYNEALNPHTSSATLTPPSIRVEMDKFDFGKVEVGQQIKQRFKIYNAGRKNLVITGLKNQCKCITFGLSSGVVEHNNSSILEITLQSDQVLQLNEDFVIQTNDPLNPEQKIRLTADIQENFSKHLFNKKSVGGIE